MRRKRAPSYLPRLRLVFVDDPIGSTCLYVRKKYAAKFGEACSLSQEELVPLLKAKTLVTVLKRMRNANIEKRA